MHSYHGFPGFHPESVLAHGTFPSRLAAMTTATGGLFHNPFLVSASEGPPATCSSSTTARARHEPEKRVPSSGQGRRRPCACIFPGVKIFSVVHQRIAICRTLLS